MDFQNNYFTINESATDLTLRHLEVSTPQYKTKTERSTTKNDINNKPQEAHNNKVGFPLPDSPDASVIIIGSIADGNAVQHFLQQRLLTEASGKNWYFLEYEDFGEDIKCQIELSNYRRLDMLNELDVVYPRFRSENTFIQPRLLTKSAAIYNWLRNGAYIYVGTLQYDIKETILRIIQRETRISRKEAIEYFDNLKKQKRFVQFVAEE